MFLNITFEEKKTEFPSRFGFFIGLQILRYRAAYITDPTPYWQQNSILRRKNIQWFNKFILFFYKMQTCYQNLDDLQ